MKKRILMTVLCISMLLTGCTNPFAKKEKKTGPPVYGKDAAYTKQIDDYLASADATVETPYGNVAIMDLPSTTQTYNAAHTSRQKKLIEALYLKDTTENVRNTDGRFITHFSYTDDMSDPENMCVGFVLQSADAPQSICLDNENALHKYYTASAEGMAVPVSGDIQAASGTAITVKYPDESEQGVYKYRIDENGKKISKKKGTDRAFSYVYIIPYNNGYVLMETYAPEDRNNISIFGKAVEKAKDHIGDSDTDYIKQLKKYVEKNRKKITADDERASVEDCMKRSEEILSNTYLARMAPKAAKNDACGDADDDTEASSGSAISYIPVYKPENTLEKPAYKDFRARMSAKGYHDKENVKAEKPKQVLHYMDFSSDYDVRNSGRFMMFMRNKHAAKKYKSVAKNIKKKDCEYFETTGKNFKVAYSYNEEKNEMWAVYLFKIRKDRLEDNSFYYYNNITKKYDLPLEISADRPVVISFKGTIADTIKMMKTIKYTKADYKGEDY